MILRRAGAALTAVMVLGLPTACGTSVDGTPTSPAGTSASVSAPTPQVPTSRPPTLFPSSAAGPVSGIGVPQVITHPHTSIGDPRLVDVCPTDDAYGPLTQKLVDRTKAAGEFVIAAAYGVRKPGQCEFGMRAPLDTYGRTFSTGYLSAIEPEPADGHGPESQQVRRGGERVLLHGLRNGFCTRRVLLSGVDLYVAGPTDAADLLGATDKARVLLSRFGAYCTWMTKKYELVAETSFTQDYGKILGDTVDAGGHTLVVDDGYQDEHECAYSSPQEKIEATRSQEFVDVSVYALTSGTKQTLCALARSAAAAILDAAGLR